MHIISHYIQVFNVSVTDCWAGVLQFDISSAVGYRPLLQNITKCKYMSGNI